MAAGGAALALLVALSGCGRLDRDAVQTEVKTIGSASAEGMLLAREAARGRAFTSYVSIHAAELHSQVEKAEDALDSTPAEDGLGDDADKAVTLAAQVRGRLERLHEHPGDRAGADRIAHELSDLSDRLDRLESGL